MSTKTVLLTSALAGVFLALSGAAAFAFTPTMAVQSSVFDHPGGEITDSIDQGDKVSVGQCQYRFCFVRDLY